MLKSLFCFLCITGFLYAGNVTLSETQVNFGDTDVGASTEQTILITNNGQSAVRIVYNPPLENAFQVQYDASSINPGEQIPITITFNPQQNIVYTDFLIIRLSSADENLICRLTGNGRMPNTYYAASFNKWGADLKLALHNIIKGHTTYSYSKLWDILSDTDEDPANPNNVILLYTGWSESKSNHGGGVSNWNREHVWAKSHGDFGTSAPAGTDVHHIRPADVSVNSTRGNLDFDNGGSLYTDGDGPTECRYDNDSWEPRDAVKGDVARMMYYMAVRYEADQTSYDLELVENIPSTGSTFGKESTLYAWQQADPVDDWERRRNDRIYNNWQHNRNPFIDYPQFIERLPSLSGKTATYANPAFVTPADSIVMRPAVPSDTRSFKLNLANSGGGTLHLQSMSLSDSHFSISAQQLTLAAESDSAVTLTFSGDATQGTYRADLQITSDDPEHAVLDIPVAVTVKTISAIRQMPSAIRSFSLGRNYPNPFNPQTVIPYSLRKSARVQLDIVDVQGRLVRQMIGGVQPPGRHRFVFDASGLPSGIYYYTLRANNRVVQTRKMILLK